MSTTTLEDYLANIEKMQSNDDIMVSVLREMLADTFKHTLKLEKRIKALEAALLRMEAGK